MRVSRIGLYQVVVPMRRTFRSSTGSVQSVSHILVRLEGALEGAAPAPPRPVAGWGEAPTPVDPYYVAETPTSAWDIIEKYLIPMVMDLDWETPGEVAVALARVKGNPLARSAVEMAAWDLWCRAGGMPLAAALNDVLTDSPPVVGTLVPPELPAPSVPAGATVGLEYDLARLLGAVDDCVAEGYGRIKVKIAPGADIAVLTALRERHPDMVVVADANGAYRGDDTDHVAILRALDGLDLAAIEQPLGDDDLVGHARLQEMLATPVALDEAITSVAMAEAVVELKACRAMSIKAPRLGGLTAALGVLSVCRSAGMGAWCGGMHELGVGRAANVALASLGGFTMPGDMAGSDRYFETDVVEPTFRVEGGRIAVPEEPGIGVEVVEERVFACAVRTLVLGG